MNRTDNNIGIPPYTFRFSQRTEQLNFISSKLEEKEKDQGALEGRIQTIDDFLNRHLAVIIDIIHVRLEMVKKLQSQVTKDFDEVQVDLKKRLISIKTEAVENYKGMLTARDGCIVNGRKIALTDDIRKKLLSEYDKDLGKNLLENEDKIRIHDKANLKDLQDNLNDELYQQNCIIDQILKQKTDLTERLIELQNDREIEILHLEKQKLFQNKSVPQLIETGDLNLLKEILTLKNVNDGFEGLTPLHHAALMGKTEIVQWLLVRLGAKSYLFDFANYLPLHYAAKNGEIASIVAIHYSYLNGLNALGAEGRTPLHMAAYNGRLGAVNTLLDSGADINIQTSKQSGLLTPLHEALRRLKLDVAVELLKRHNLNPNLQDSIGETPLEYAVKIGDVNTITLILGHKNWKLNPNLQKKLDAIIPSQNAKEIKKYLSALIKK